jgi:hypothetical protein
MSFLVNPYAYGPFVCTDADALAFLTAAGITNPTITSAICSLVTTMKADGTWAKMNAIYPMVGGTAATHKFNLKNPLDTNGAFRLTFSGGITHSANGVAFNGTNGYADTFMAASTTLTANNTSLSYYSRTATASSATFAIDMGAAPNQSLPPSNYALVLRRTGDSTIFIAATNTIAINTLTTTTNGSGLFTGSIVNSSSRKLYRNGSAIATNTTTGIQSLPPQKIFIGALSNGNTASLFSNKECAFASIGSGLSDAEALALYNSVQAFNTTLGRQV